MSSDYVCIVYGKYIIWLWSIDSDQESIQYTKWMNVSILNIIFNVWGIFEHRKIYFTSTKFVEVSLEIGWFSRIFFKVEETKGSYQVGS